MREDDLLSTFSVNDRQATVVDESANKSLRAELVKMTERSDQQAKRIGDLESMRDFLTGELEAVRASLADQAAGYESRLRDLEAERDRAWEVSEQWRRLVERPWWRKIFG